jgi:uncharacterized protein (DUF2267 family)
MATSTVDSIERTVQKAREWVKDLAAELGTDDHEFAWRALRTYLQALRERLTVEEAAQLAAQFPHLIRGVYYEGFVPGRQPVRIRDRDEFLARIAERGVMDKESAAKTTAACTRVLRHHVSEGEVDQVLGSLPGDIRRVLEPAA